MYEWIGEGRVGMQLTVLIANILQCEVEARAESCNWRSYDGRESNDSSKGVHISGLSGAE